MSRVPQQPDQNSTSPAFLLHKEGYSIKDYRLIARIGEGSFGQVWKAERGGFEVALKILKASVNSEETQRELKSLETLKRLHHKYLLHTENFWSDGDQLYIEMELADGGTLKDRFKACLAEGKEGIPPDELLKYFTEAAKALDYLHSHRPVFLHRDIKPANVLLVKGCAKLGDFGLLRQVSNNDATHTQGGTIPYMAPESIKEDKFSVATDVFSFAVMYAELRQGHLPFMGSNQFQICDRILTEDPKLTDIFDPGERKVLLKALSKRPEDRFASCGEFVFELNRVVPWLPATNVPTSSASGPGAPDTNPAKTTDSRAPRVTDNGTSLRGKPVTMPDVDLDDSSQRLGTPTHSKSDGTIPSEKDARSTKPTKPPQGPQYEPGTKPTQTGSSKSNPFGADKAKPAPTPVVERKKKAKRLLPAIVLLLLVIGVFVGVAVGANLIEHNSISKKIDNGDFAAALQRIDGRWLLLPGQAQELKQKMEEKWWSGMKVPSAADSPDLLNAQLADLKEFQDVFPQNAEANVRKGKIEAFVSVKNELRQKVLASLKIAKDEFEKKQFEKSLGTLKTVEPEYQNDLKERNDLRAKTIAAVKKRGEDHDRLTADYNKVNDGRQTALAKLKRDEVVLFESAYPSANYPKLDPLKGDDGPNELLRMAWVRLLAKTVVAKDAHDALAVVLKHQTQYKDDPSYQKHVLAFRAFVLAYDANAANWDVAADELVKVQRDLSPQDDLNVKFWQALVRLEANNKMLRLIDLRRIDQTFTKQNSPAPVQESFTELLPLVLERLAKQEPMPWYPKDTDLKPLVDLSAKVKGPSDPLSTLWVESQLRLDEPVGKISFAKTDWYGWYVAALAEPKLSESANLLVEKLSGKPADVKPSGRAATASKRLHDAVKSLERSGSTFVRKHEAKSALAWLKLSIQLSGQGQNAKLDDAIILDFAYAAAKAEDIEALEFARMELDNSNPKDPAMLKCYDVVSAAALKVSTTHYGTKNYAETIAASKISQKAAFPLRKLDQYTAAFLNSQAIELHALSEHYIEFAKSKNENNPAYYKVYADATPGVKQLEAFHLPLVAQKLMFAPLGAEQAKSTDEGENVLKSSKAIVAKETGKDKDERVKWWQKLRGITIAKVGDNRLDAVVAAHVKAAKNPKTKLEGFRADYLKSLEYFKEERSLEEYWKRRAGELSFQIGRTYYAISDWAPDKEQQKAEAKLAVQELEAALTAFEAIPLAKRTERQKDEIEKCKAMIAGAK